MEIIREQIARGQQICSTCNELNPEFCSDGVHWVRAILRHEVTCSECPEIASYGDNGKAYCWKH
jgi:hypothetical protein